MNQTMRTSKTNSAEQTAEPAVNIMHVAGRHLLDAGHQIVLYVPPLILLFLPLLALLPDQGHDVIETVVTGKQWAYIAIVLVPLALTVLLHSIQMLRRSAQLRGSPDLLTPADDGRTFWWTVVLALLGMAVLAAPLYFFELGDTECIKTIVGLAEADECHPSWPLVGLSAYCSFLILIPFIAHYRATSGGKMTGRIKRVAWHHAPSIVQLALVSVMGIVVVRDDAVIKDYGPVVLGALAALFVARLPTLAGLEDCTKRDSYWRRMRVCVGDGWTTLVLAAISLALLAIYPMEIGARLGSLFVLYSGVLSWLAIVSFAWSCFLLLRDRLSVAGLGILSVGLLTVIGVLYGSYDAITATKTSADIFNGVASSEASLAITATATDSIEHDFKAWSSVVGGSGSPRKVVIILAEGGGIRAAQWANEMLFTLNAGDSNILRNTYAIVGVSGGALGATSYLANLAALYDYQLGHGGGSKVPGEPTFVAFNNAQRALAQDLMAPWLARFITVGAIQAVLPRDAAPSAVLLALWKDNLTCAHEQFPRYLIPEYREVCARLPSLMNAPMRGFPTSVGEHALPRLVYTATHIETGARVVESSVDFTPLDFPDAFDVNRALGGNISLLDATYSSARFPGISRPGALVDAKGKVHGHVVDGGYLDGSGALTASDIVDAIERAGEGKVIPVVLDLDNSPDDDKASQNVPDSMRAAGAAITQMYGMFKGIKQANGMRDLAAVASLRRQVCALGGGLLTLQVPRKAGPLALGWTLSQQASNRLDSAGFKVAQPLTHSGARPAGPESLENAFKLARAHCT
ncbi:hypothetical protein [Paraburkholderia atlantica]|uniref:hypothetical protein n=1 Tax=Paraburkholderia atlantica TaxID=2654982 RepID=UPI001D1055CC|nr:hypothetical protein [Paraburkholderia atlantica]